MFNNYKKNKSKGLPKYSGGGLGMVGKDLKNTGLFLADTALAEWAPNLISQDQYSDTKYGANLGKVASVHESFDSMSPIRKNVSKMWTDDRSSGMNEEQQKAFNQVQPIAKLGSSIGEMWTAKGLGSIGQGGTDAAGNFQPSQANGFAKSLGDLSQAGTKNYTPNMYDNNSQTTVGDLSNSRRASMYPNGGIITQPNAELELDESVLHTDGTATQLNNEPSHEEGGKPMKLNPGDMIFSDKIKWNGKTAADHNKPYTRIIQKATKDLENSSLTKESKLSAHLNLMAATKASQAIFAKQEEIKQSRIDSYTKRLGGIQQFPLGGAVDNTKFTPAQKQQAYTDSMTLYKSGFNKNVPNWQAEPEFNNAVLRLNKLNGVPPESTDKSPIASDYNYLQNRSVPYAKPTAPEVQYKPKDSFKPSYPMEKLQLKDLYTQPDINPQFQSVPANRPNTINTQIYTGPNMSYKEYKQGNEVMDRMYFDPSTKKEINIEGFAWGGVKTPKPNFNQSESSYQFGRAKFLSNGQLDKTNPLAKYNAEYLKPEDNTDYSRMNQDLYDEELARMNASSGNGDKSNWFNRNSDNLYQAGFGIAQNAGQLAYLSEQGKRYDTQQYHTYSPELMNKSAAIRDAKDQARRTAYNVVGKSAGNSGNALSNLIALNAQSTINQSRISQEYDNANASIKNRANEVNLANRYSVDDINAKNKGAALNQYYKAIGSIGVNTAQGLKDNKNRQMDEKTIGMFTELYNNPEFQKFMKEQKK